MSSRRKTEKFIKNAAVHSDLQTNQKVLEELLKELLEIQQKQSAEPRPVLWRIIMKNNIVKLAAVAVIIIGVLIGIHYSGGSIDGSSVVWADVVEKIQASRGLIFRSTATNSPLPSDYTISYKTPRYDRIDYYENGQITNSYYTDFETMTSTTIWHAQKLYFTNKITTMEGFLEQQEDWMNPMYLIERFLLCEYRELGQKTIDGVLCEGIETTDPDILLNSMTEEMMEEEGAEELIDSLEVQMRLWVDSETQYPVMFEWKTKALILGEMMENESISSQFQWDVDLDPSIFEPEIPSGYTDITQSFLRRKQR